MKKQSEIFFTSSHNYRESLKSETFEELWERTKLYWKNEFVKLT